MFEFAFVGEVSAPAYLHRLRPSTTPGDKHALLIFAEQRSEYLPFKIIRTKTVAVKGEVALFSSSTMSLERSFVTEGIVNDACQSPDGKLIAAVAVENGETSDFQLVLWNAENGEHVGNHFFGWAQPAPSHTNMLIAFDYSGQRVAVGGSNSGMMIIDVATQTKLIEANFAHLNNIRSLVWLNPGELIISEEERGNVYKLDATSLRVRGCFFVAEKGATVSTYCPMIGAAATRDGRWVFVRGNSHVKTLSIPADSFDANEACIIRGANPSENKVVVWRSCAGPVASEMCPFLFVSCGCDFKMQLFNIALSKIVATVPTRGTDSTAVGNTVFVWAEQDLMIEVYRVR